VSQIFISYRHVKPDAELAASLKKSFASRGHETFIDTGIRVGEDWAAAIDRALRDTDFFIVLLSEVSIVSDMVRKEIALAHELAKASPTRPRILPVRLNFEGKLPYDLGAYLDRLQYLLWKPDQPMEALSKQLLEAMEAEVPEGPHVAPEELSYEGNEELYAATEGKGAPLPAADPRLVQVPDSGTLQIDSPFYVRRDSDDAADACLRQQTPTTIVKAPRQMGKSSLLARMHAQAQALGRKSWYLDFQLVDSEHMENLDTLFRHLARQMGRAFAANLHPKDVWDEDEGPMGNLTTYLEDAVLAPIESPVQIVFDEADRVFDRPYRDKLFATVRGWHNLRSTNPRFRKLTLVIGHSTTPTLWIQDVNQSPFNIGHPIRLRTFAAAEIAQLASNHACNLSADEIDKLLNLLGGHPYLTRLALYMLAANGWTAGHVINIADDESGPFGDHLRGLSWMLQQSPELHDCLRSVAQGKGCADEKHFQKLWAAGLVRGQTRAQARITCDLYERYLRNHL